MTLDYDSIYSISDPVSNRIYRGGIADHNLADLRLYRGELKIDETVLVGYQMGEGEPSPVIWTTNAHPLVVSEHIIDLFLVNGIQGWDTINVKVFDKNGDPVKLNYFGLVIKGRVGYVDYSRSSMIYKKMGIKESPHIQGRYFFEDKWDGSDLFMESPNPDGKINGFRYCTKNVFRILRKAKIGNLVFEQLREEAIWLTTIESGASPYDKTQLEKLKKKART